jgi:AraC-like DNA-binding protein
MAARVRALLLEDPAAMPSVTALAERLSFDERTLRRRLAAEGTSYRALRQEVAMTLALELLRGAGLTVAEVAARVGYADPTGFTHAFTRWHGRPPSAARR